MAEQDGLQRTLGAELYADSLLDLPYEALAAHQRLAQRRLASGDQWAAGEIMVAGIVESCRASTMPDDD